VLPAQRFAGLLDSPKFNKRLPTGFRQAHTRTHKVVDVKLHVAFEFGLKLAIAPLAANQACHA
jgi:hypothetical protein